LFFQLSGRISQKNEKRKENRTIISILSIFSYKKCNLKIIFIIKEAYLHFKMKSVVSQSLEEVSSVFPEELCLLSEFIEKTDSDERLSIFSYKSCNNSSDANVKSCRGVVYSDGKPLFRSLGYTPEYNETDVNILNLDFTDMTFYPSMEGTLLRLFYKEKWYLSTHRKLDAFKSKWGGAQSFGEIFTKGLQNRFSQDYTLENFTSTLSTENVYLFLVRNVTENRMVSRAPEKETVYHVGTLLHGQEWDTNVDVGLERPTPLQLTTKDELCDYVKSVDPFVCQGVIAFYKDGTQFKVVNSQYQLYSNVRGNESSIMFRYLQVRSNPAYSKLLAELYPEKESQMLLYENTIFQIAKFIHSSYMERFVNKKQVVVPKEEYVIIRECHGWHIQDRQNNKVSLNVVLSTLNQSKFLTLLNFLVKKYIKTNKA